MKLLTERKIVTIRSEIENRMILSAEFSSASDEWTIHTEMLSRHSARTRRSKNLTSTVIVAGNAGSKIKKTRASHLQISYTSKYLMGRTLKFDLHLKCNLKGHLMDDSGCTCSHSLTLAARIFQLLFIDIHPNAKYLLKKGLARRAVEELR